MSGNFCSDFKTSDLQNLSFIIKFILKNMKTIFTLAVAFSYTFCGEFIVYI